MRAYRMAGGTKHIFPYFSAREPLDKVGREGKVEASEWV